MNALRSQENCGLRQGYNNGIGGSHEERSLASSFLPRSRFGRHHPAAPTTSVAAIPNPPKPGSQGNSPAEPVGTPGRSIFPGRGVAAGASTGTACPRQGTASQRRSAAPARRSRSPDRAGAVNRDHSPPPQPVAGPSTEWDHAHCGMGARIVHPAAPLATDDARSGSEADPGHAAGTGAYAAHARTNAQRICLTVNPGRSGRRRVRRSTTVRQPGRACRDLQRRHQVHRPIRAATAPH